MEKNDSFAIASELLCDNELNSLVKIHLDCADIAYDYTNIIHNSIKKVKSNFKYYEPLTNKNKKLEKAFASNLEHILLKKVDYNNIELCNSMFPFIENYLQSLSLSKKVIKIFIPEDIFGYFNFILERKCGYTVELLKTGENFKVSKKSFKNISTINDNTFQILIWLNPINPTQTFYNKNEVKEIKEEIKKKFDIIIEDITFADLYDNKYPDGVFNKFRRFVEYEDIIFTRDKSFNMNEYNISNEDSKNNNIDKSNESTVTHPHYLCQEQELQDKTIITYSITKSLSDKNTISMAFIPSQLKLPIPAEQSVVKGEESKEDFYEKKAIICYLLNNKSPIIYANIVYYKESHAHITNECDLFNTKINYLCKLNIDSESIKSTPKVWKCTNIINIDCTELSSLLILNCLLPNKYKDLHSNLYEYFIRNTGAKMISGSSNNMKKGNLYFRLPLGGYEVKERISIFFNNLFVSIKTEISKRDSNISSGSSEVISNSKQTSNCYKNKSKQIITMKSHTKIKSKYFSKDDLQLNHYMLKTEEIKLSYENTSTLIDTQ